MFPTPLANHPGLYSENQKSNQKIPLPYDNTVVGIFMPRKHPHFSTHFNDIFIGLTAHFSVPDNKFSEILPVTDGV